MKLRKESVGKGGERKLIVVSLFISIKKKIVSS